VPVEPEMNECERGISKMYVFYLKHNSLFWWG